MSDIRDQLEAKIKSFLKERKRPADEDHHVRTAIRALDAFWWTKCFNLIEEHSPDPGTVFSLDSEKRRIFDAGLVDTRLIGSTAGELEHGLDSEFGEKIDGNIFYLSEWLQHCWEFDVELYQVEDASSDQSADFRDDPGYINCHETRMEVIRKLKHLIQGLPGVSPAIIEMLLTGRLLMHLEDQMFLEQTGQEAAQEADKKLVKFFRSLLLRLKERCLTKPHQEAFSEWMMRQDRIFKIIQDSAKDYKVDETLRTERSLAEITSLDNMTANLKLLKSLIPIGVASSGLDIPFCPLFEDGERSTKTAAKRHWEHLMSADPLLPGDPDILIAPFTGNGFFEWDRNTMILPLTSEHSRAYALVNAVAGYRIMTDTLNFEGRLRKAWISEFGDELFKERFVEAYHNWVLGVGYGRRLAMAPETFIFFVENIGPNPQKGIGPSHLLKMDSEAQIMRLKECRTAINKGSTAFDNWYDLAVIHWRRHNIREALEAMEKAHEIKPDDPCIHFSLIYLGQRVNWLDAKKRYSDLARKHPKTLWRVYAEIQMENDRL